MNIQIICVGGLKEAYWRDACTEYAKRLSAYCTFSVTEVAETKMGKSPSAAEIARTIESEGERILQKLPKGAYTVALCIEGKLISSEDLAGIINDAGLSGKSTIALLIGGSHGLSEAVKQRAQLRISMGRMTFPHQLARVMLCEQLYRACSINGGGQYHK